MSSSYDAGHYAEESRKAKDKPCSKGGEHKWKEHGTWPSLWWKCTKCKETRYAK